MRSQIATSVSRSWVTMNDGQAEALLQVADQLVEVGGADRVEAGGRLVEEQDLGVERQRARQAGALAHAAGQLARDTWRPASAGRPTSAILRPRSSSHQRCRQSRVLAQRHLDVLGHGQRAEQRAVLEQHAPARSAARAAPRRRQAADVAGRAPRSSPPSGRLQADDACAAAPTCRCPSRRRRRAPRRAARRGRGRHARPARRTGSPARAPR